MRRGPFIDYKKKQEHPIQILPARLVYNTVELKSPSTHGALIKYLFTIVFLSYSAQVLAACPNCNIILISMDTVGAKHLSLYGAKRKTSPNIDALAKQSRVYKNAYSTAPWTLPSHGSMLTGMYPWNLYPPGERGYLSTSVKTMAEVLKNNGYKTAAFTDGFYLSKDFKFNRGFEIFESQNAAFKNTGIKQNIIKSIRFLHKQKKQPFFLFVHTYNAHEPFTPSEESVRALGGDTRAPLSIEHQQIIDLNQPDKSVQPELADKMLLLYQAEIFEIDLQLGHLFAELQKQDLFKNTIVIITSDHGEEMGEHGSWGLHGFSSYNEQLHIPLVFYVPNESSKEIMSPVSLIDILPTVLAQTKITINSRLNGLPLPEVDNIAALDRGVLASGPNISKPRLLEFLLIALNKQKNQVGPVVNVPHKNQNDFQALESVLITKDKKVVLVHEPLEFKIYNLKNDPLEKKPKIVKCNDEFCQTLKLFFATSPRLNL